MLERQEIDALLISALYGELTPAEESRLEAHFEAHPADKTALATLTSTRDAVRESRILKVQADPPQSITAVLLQEAARRAPKKKETDEREGWFARLARSFMAHPAMAAAAMLVIVLGVTTIVKNRGNDQFAESTAPTSSQVVSDRADRGAAAGSGSAVAAADQQAPGQMIGGDGKDEYRVGLAEGDLKNDRYAATETTAALDAGLVAQEQEKEVDSLRRRQEVAKAELAKQQQERKTQTAAVRDDSSVASAGKAKKGTAGPSGSYLELRSPEANVKDLDGAPEPAPGRVYNYEDYLAKENVNAVTPGPSSPAMTPGSGASGGGNATAPRTGYAQPPADATTGKVAGNTKSDPKPADAKKAAESQTKSVAQQPTTTAPRGNAAPPKAPPPPPPSKVATNTTSSKPPPANTNRPASAPAEKPRAIAPAEDKAANDPQLAWAREQHGRIISKVRAGDCKGAAEIAVVLANRDLAYYKQNVATDRSVKECLAYIDNAREKDQEQRAEKAPKRRTVNEPAKASPPAAVDAAESK
jgi:hypothetical protein